jgi:hypothetical protein
MPSKSRAQQKLMHAAAKSPAVAKKTGVPQSVAKEFVKADHARGTKKLPEKVTPQK